MLSGAYTNLGRGTRVIQPEELRAKIIGDFEANLHKSAEHYGSLKSSTKINQCGAYVVGTLGWEYLFYLVLLQPLPQEVSPSARQGAGDLCLPQENF